LSAAKVEITADQRARVDFEMAIASISTITSASENSWQEAAELGFARANETLRGITGIKVMDEKARVEDGVIVEYLVTLEVIFLLDESEGD
jgi:flavin-binding protein dodecin